MDVFYSLCHSILCRRGELASIYAPQLVQILLGGVGLLDVLADKVKRGADGTTGQFVKLTRDDCLKIYQLMR